MPRAKLRLALTTFLMSAAAPSLAQPTPTPQPPQQTEPRWVVDASEFTCTMGRDLPGTPPAALTVRTYPGSGDYLLILASTEWPRLIGDAAPAVSIQFAGSPEKFRANPVQVRSARRFAIAASLPDDFLERFGRSSAVSVLANDLVIASYQLPQRDAVARAFAECESSALVEWGAERGAFQAGGRRAKPVGEPHRWLSFEDIRVPSGMNHLAGLIRMSVTPEGRVSACTMFESTLTPALQDAGCRIIMRRARFEPARAPDGSAVRSVVLFRQSLRREFVIG